MIRHFSHSARVEQPVSSLVDFTGKWSDENGSILHLSLLEFRLTGTFVVDFHRNGMQEEFPLLGFIQGDLICFAVSFAKYGSLSSFAGQYLFDEVGASIKVVWLLTETVRDSKNGSERVGAILTGSSEFRRTQSGNK